MASASVRRRCSSRRCAPAISGGRPDWVGGENRTETRRSRIGNLYRVETLLELASIEARSRGTGAFGLHGIGSIGDEIKVADRSAATCREADPRVGFVVSGSALLVRALGRAENV